MALTDKALTASLIISNWAARKYDKKVSEEVEEAHGAKDAGRYNKLLISKDKLQQIQKVVTKLRAFHYINTLPWADSGERLLPSANYLNYISELNILRSEFNKAVKEFVGGYNTYIEDARTRLGDMFDINDYPTDKQIQEKFRIKAVFMPIPESDFRVQLGDEEVKSLKTAMEIEIQDRLSTAMKDAWVRISDSLTHMRDKLREKKEYVDDQGVKQIRDGIFKNSLFENVEELTELLPKLNVTDDPKLIEVCNDMKALIVDPDTVRSDNTLRNIKADEVDKIMEKYKDFF